MKEEQHTEGGAPVKKGASRIPQRGIPPVCEPQLRIPASHIDSFDYFLNTGMNKAVEDLKNFPEEVEIPELGKFKFWFDSVYISSPCHTTHDNKMYPADCRQMGSTYNAPCFGVICRQINGGGIETEQRLIGRVPIMVKSEKCHLRGKTPEELVALKEEPNEMGGYFICNGLEKLVRLLVVPRSNNPMAIKQPKNVDRGKSYSPYGVEIRCLQGDHTTVRNTIHYLNDGNCTLRFSISKREYFVPVVVLLKAFIDTTDREIYEKLTRGDDKNTFLTDRVELLLREAKRHPAATVSQALSFLGTRFRLLVRAPASKPDREVGEELIRRYILVHLPNMQAKFNYLLFLIRKLYAFVAGDIRADNPDSQMNHDILLPGNVFMMIFKEQLQEYLLSLRIQLEMDVRRKSAANFYSTAYFQKSLTRCRDIGKTIDYFLSTGNIRSRTGLDLLQKSGFTIVAEKLNYLRYLSHFRGVHRGQFFTTMKTTRVRKLLPDGWGFMCPVHTPDGAPCGLLNHISATCELVTEPESALKLPKLMATLGMKPIQSAIVYDADYVPVMLDAEILGYLPPDIVDPFVNRLRYFKVEQHPDVPRHLEIVKAGAETRQFPGVYLFNTLGRFSRKVLNLKCDKEEYIGSMEQAYMEIACVPEDLNPKTTTHSELSPMNMLSIIASLTPFSDFNQSPRNMYQCQMGKQTMATPCTAYIGRVDNKMYRIQNPQIPIVRNDNQDKYRIDDFPNGTNAVVAVISYTGYDMEDAMIINKSAYERGFGHASVYKVETVNLRERGSSGFEEFSNPLRRTAEGEEMYAAPTLGPDGLPFVGQYMEQGSPYLCIKDTQTDKITVKRYKSKEPSFVEQITVVDSTVTGATKVNIKFRINRNPIIGDKFSSRHGQKGVLSKLWPSTDMPFSESGMTPDVIINPHAFPSRMTIGMLIESMAGKSGALHGHFVNATPFRYDEKNTAVDYFGEQLLKAGYNYYGNETMYSGISGTPMQADIFFGVVYYQRLRHMVSDKFQVRSTGPINNLTRQPVKGRKLGGGIRLGEMERDSLLAHGASYMLHDRLMNCSDTHKGYVCKTCGSLVSALNRPATSTTPAKVICVYCNSSDGIRLLNLPFVFRYLANELAAMNIRIGISIKDAS